MIRHWLFLLFCFWSLVFYSQKLKFPEQKSFEWSDNNFKYPIIPDSLKNEDIVILRDEFTLINKALTRRIVFKVLTKEGVAKASHFVLPEDMDLINFSNENKQGRFKDQKIPFCYTYDIRYFSARVIKKNLGPIEIFPEAKNSEVFWVKHDGERIKQEVLDFSINEVDLDCIVEITYKVDVGRSRHFISLNTHYPRLYLKVKTNTFLGFHNLRPQDTLQFRKPINKDGIYLFEFKALKSINHPDNAGGLKKLPYLVFGEYHLPWIYVTDSLSKTKYNTREQISFRKYADQFERSDSDSSGNKMLTVMIDSINNLTFVTAESMHYSSEAQYAVTSAEHLLKRRLIEEFTIKTYDRLLEEKKIFFYIAFVGDKRKSEINEKFFSNTIYQETVFAVPESKSMVFYKTRKNGLKYFPNELPFYLENSKCALIPQNIQFAKDKDYASKMAVTRTPKSSYNDNVRLETARCLVSIDTMTLRLGIKESLNGQFSTILRPYYNKEYIDSTVPSVYFKKCTDKPNATAINIKKGSSTKMFPFKHTYNCGETMNLTGSEIDLTDWFSFLYSENTFKKVPNHDFYVDFQFTDSYNYLFEFDKAIEILNSGDFTKKLSNEYFEISCNLVKQESNKYLLSLIVKLKQDVIPEKDAQKMMDFVNMLDELNKMKLNYKIL